MNDTKPKWPETLVYDIEATYHNRRRDYLNTTENSSELELANLKASVVDHFSDKFPEVDFYYDEILARLDSVPQYPGKVISKLTSQKETLKMAKYLSQKKLSNTEMVLGFIAATIIYGGGFLFLIYIITHLG